MDKKSGMKRLVSVCTAAMMMATVSVGMTGAEMFANPSAVITASAAASQFTVSAERYGLSVPAESVSVQRNGIIIKEMTWEEFVEGTSILSQTDSTLVVLQYSDGTLELNAYTGEVVSNTRKSGVYRDKFYLTKEVFAKFAESAGISTIIDPFVTSDEEYKAESTYLAKNFELYVVTTERDSENRRSVTYLNDTPYTTDDLKDGSLEFDYPAGKKVYLVYGYTPYLNVSGAASVAWTGIVAEYDVTSQSIVSWYQSVTSPTSVYFSPDSFPAEQGYENVVVTGHNLLAGNYEYGTIVTGNSSMYISSVTYTQSEFVTGGCYVNTINALQGYLTKIDELVKVRFNYADGSYSEYTVVGNTLNEIAGEERTMEQPDSDVLQYITGDSGNSAEDIYDNPLYNAVDDDGNLQVSNELLNTPERDYNYYVEIYRGAELIQTLSKSDYEDTTTKISYDDTSNYYVKVYYENGTDYTAYRFYPCFGSWLQRIDTEQTPVVQQQVSALDFPTEYSSCDVYYSGKSILSLTADDFGNSGTFDQIANMSSNYSVVFHTDGGDTEYTYIGIDAEPLGNVPSETLCKKENLTETVLHPAGDVDVTEPDKPVFHVDGETETGEHISGDVFPVLSDGTAVAELPDGDYIITDLNSGLTTDITVDKDNSGNGTHGNDVTDVGRTAVVEVTPEMIIRITVTTPEGTLILADDAIFSVEDLNPDSFVDSDTPYFEYESVSGIGNSVNDDDKTTEHGYFTVKDGEITVIGDVLKGDVNLDGKFDILDAIVAKKYLHQNKKLDFGIENYIAMDVYSDGVANVYDFVTLKQMLLK